MSSARLRGVWCADCLKRGHKCQAQLEAVSSQLSAGSLECVPLCVRCADGEPCCFETAKALPAITRLDEALDDPLLGVMKLGRIYGQVRKSHAELREIAGRMEPAQPVKLKGDEKYFESCSAAKKKWKRHKRQRLAGDPRLPVGSSLNA